MTHTELYEFLVTQRLAVLATVTPTNSSESALMGVAVTPDLEIVFDTLKSSRKYSNLKANPACSLVIGWTGGQSVQYEGVAEELEGAELERYQPLYFRAFPDGPSRLAWPGIVYFVVRPVWIRYGDFDQRPPVIEEFSFVK